MAYNFDTIARTYDRLNRVMTMGLDCRWRKLAVHGLYGHVLDVACGTGDMVVELMKQGCTVTGVDISEEMLEVARFKVQGSRLMVADAEHLPFEDSTFDAVTCAFGVRNFVHLEQGLSEMLRVLKPGGTMVILELATPDSPLIRPFYNLYTKHIIPWLGSRIAGSREAYTYLPESINRFPKGNDFLKIVLNSQLTPQGRRPWFSMLNCSQQRLTFDVCRLYKVVKNKEVAQ